MLTKSLESHQTLGDENWGSNALYEEWKIYIEKSLFSIECLEKPKQVRVADWNMWASEASVVRLK